MESLYSKSSIQQALYTVDSICEVIDQIVTWNGDISSADDYYNSQTGMQLLTANCTLITAIGEGVNRINRILPDFLTTHFPQVPWRLIIGMRNHIAHGYFELDGDLIYEAIKSDIPPLLEEMKKVRIALTTSFCGGR